MKIRQVFFEMFGCQPVVARAPGRINLLGEHTDYNEGFVLPASIDRYAFVAVQKRDDRKIRLFAMDVNETAEFSLDDLHPVTMGWCNYILGIAHEFCTLSLPLNGFNLVLTSDVPSGAGLSSSAAISCATALALNHLFQCKVDKLEMAQMAQKAEHQFAGVQCGIMDPFASLFGRADHVIRLDCRSLQYAYIPVSFPDHQILLVDSGVKHALASSAYNERRAQCREGVRIIADRYPGVRALRDASARQVDECLTFNPVLHKRCRYVVDENQRVLDACADLESGDVKALGIKMALTHKGLQHQYEVSCAELDFLVQFALSMEGVAGARMMGGGFGGCTINLVRKDRLDSFIQEITHAYLEKWDVKPNLYRINIVDGAELI